MDEQLKGVEGMRVEGVSKKIKNKRKDVLNCLQRRYTSEGKH